MFALGPYALLFSAVFKLLEYLASIHNSQTLGSVAVPAALLLDA